MRRQAHLSILGLYLYDRTIFDNMSLPEGVDKTTLVPNLVSECADFEILYPDPDMMKTALEFWSAKELPVWEKEIATTKLEYDPISNYDRKEEWTDTDSGEDTETRNLTVTGKSGSSSESKVAAYNDVDMQPNASATNNGDSTETDSGTVTHGYGKTNKRTGRAYGNIGVTTSQQMIEAEREVVKFNIYDFIINSFKSRFCLLNY